MKKSILDQFASDAINAPVAVTGGGHKKERKEKTSHKSREHKREASREHKSREVLMKV